MIRFTENNRKLGTCVHLVIDYACSYGKYQNFPCPYRNKPENCPCCVTFTEQMEKDLKEKGYFSY